MGMFGDIFGGIGDAIGNWQSGDDRNKAMQSYVDAQNAYKGIDPTVAAQQAGASAYLSADPAGRQAQMDALSTMRGQVNQGGLDAIGRAQLAQAQNAGSQMAQSQAQGAMQAAAARGQGGSGNALLGQMVAGQNGANLANQQGLQAAAFTQQARQQALQGMQQGAGQMRSQDYDRAGALDAIQRFNAGQRQQAGLATQQGQFQRAGGEANALTGQAGQNMANANATRQMWGGFGKAVGGAGDAAAAAMTGGASAAAPGASGWLDPAQAAG
jgi:hypothetical protein